MANRTYLIDKDLLPVVDELGSILDMGEKFMVSAYMISLAVGIRENRQRESSGTKSSRGPRTALKAEHFTLMQAAVRSVVAGADLDPESDEFAEIVSNYAHGGLEKIGEVIEDSQDPKAALVVYLGELMNS